MNQPSAFGWRLPNSPEWKIDAAGIDFENRCLGKIQLRKLVLALAAIHLPELSDLVANLFR
jgi:hypothetical protein